MQEAREASGSHVVERAAPCQPTGATGPTPSLWLGAARLVLASKSASRALLFKSAGLDFDIDGARLDEREVEDDFLGEGGDVAGLAACLAKAKGREVSGRNRGALCVAADQTLSVEGRLLHKPEDMAAAERQLLLLAGKIYILTSAVCVARDGVVLFEAADVARLTTRRLDEAAIRLYLAIVGEGVLSSVGAYQIEGLGVHLFEKVEGEHATILGLPLMRLLAWLRSQGYLAI